MPHFVQIFDGDVDNIQGHHPSKNMRCDPWSRVLQGEKAEFLKMIADWITASTAKVQVAEELPYLPGDYGQAVLVELRR